jgi:acyl carrier protein phosphodiesterase
VNHLAHFALAGRDADLLVGGFLGDYTKGRLNGKLASGIERGIALHRAIDAYTDQHEIVKTSRERFSAEFRRYAGIITDVLYDHLLAQHWLNFYQEPLDDFSKRTLGILLANKSSLTDNAADTATRMHEYNSLAHYGETKFVINALTHISTRLKRANPLGYASDEALACLPALRNDLLGFYPQLVNFSDEWQNSH